MSDFRQTIVAGSGRVGHVPLDHQQCYVALRSRDRRFDGTFWTGVTTTGIYCRPVCPSRTPRSANVTFFAHPAAAEAAGFRPCRRCQPDAAPGSAAWRGNAEVVDRAMRLIARGALDGGTVEQLAGQLNVGARHLRRLFDEHVGAGPLAVARTRRAHLAHRLLIDTDLPAADVAFASGFGSVRQFNDVLRATFHASPSEIRSNSKVRRPRDGNDWLTVNVVVREPFCRDRLFAHFSGRAVPGIESADADGYTRRLRIGDDIGEVRVGPGHTGLTLAVSPPLVTHLGRVLAGVRRLFDTDADPSAIADRLGDDPHLGPSFAADPGLRVPGSWSGFEAAVRAIVNQQISVAGATTVVGRIAAAFGQGAFPEPEHLVDAELEPLGLISRRADTIRTVARHLIDGTLALDGTMPFDELETSLLDLDGVGPWTAAAIALRIGEPDAFPAGDLHIRRVLGVEARAATAMAEAWRPWRAYAATHLWAQAAAAA